MRPSAQATHGKLQLLWSLTALPHPHFKHIYFCQHLTNHPLASISNNLHTSSTYIHSLTHTFWSLFKDLSSLICAFSNSVSSALHHSSSRSSRIAVECDQGTRRSLCTTEKASGLIAVIDTSSCKDESFLVYILLQPTECFLRKPKETKEEARKTKKWKKVPATVCHSGVDTCDFHDIFIYHTYVKLFRLPTKRSRNCKSQWDLLTFLWSPGRNFLSGTKIKLFWLPFHSCERPTAFWPAGFSLWHYTQVLI